jgi:hypothetical protein
MKTTSQKAKAVLLYGWVVLCLLAFRLSLFQRTVFPIWQSR